MPTCRGIGGGTRKESDLDTPIVRYAGGPMLTLTPAGQTVASLATELGRVRYERDLLLRQVLAVHRGLADGTADSAWRTLLRTARWLEADDSLGEPS